MPFPERQTMHDLIFHVHNQMYVHIKAYFLQATITNTYLSHKNNDIRSQLCEYHQFYCMFETAYCTSELRHHVQVLHVHSSAPP